MRRLLLLCSLALVSMITTLAPAQAAKRELALGGNCPVALVTMHKLVKGDPRFSSVTGGRVYLFSDADAKRMYDADPKKFQVAYDGRCATGCAMGHDMAGDPMLHSELNGVTYVFSSAEAKKAFDGDPSGMAMKADAYYAKRMAMMKKHGKGMKMKDDAMKMDGDKMGSMGDTH